MPLVNIHLELSLAIIHLELPFVMQLRRHIHIKVAHLTEDMLLDHISMGSSTFMAYFYPNLGMQVMYFNRQGEYMDYTPAFIYQVANQFLRFVDRFTNIKVLSKLLHLNFLTFMYRYFYIHILKCRQK